jgi:hypothetical protein
MSKYEDYIKSLGFLSNEVEALAKHARENGGVMSVYKDSEGSKAKLLFTTGIDNKIIIHKNKKQFSAEFHDGKKQFANFSDMTDYLDQET